MNQTKLYTITVRDNFASNIFATFVYNVTMIENQCDPALLDEASATTWPKIEFPLVHNMFQEDLSTKID